MNADTIDATNNTLWLSHQGPGYTVVTKPGRWSEYVTTVRRTNATGEWLVMATIFTQSRLEATRYHNARAECEAREGVQAPRGGV